VLVRSPAKVEVSESHSGAETISAMGMAVVSRMKSTVSKCSIRQPTILDENVEALLYQERRVEDD